MRFWFFWLSLVMVGTARGASARLLFAQAPRAGEWATIVVEGGPAAGGGTVAIRDQRGGVTVAREGAGKLLLALPYVAPAELPPGRWPVEITSVAAGGEREVVRVDLAVGMASDSPRVAEPGGRDVSVEDVVNAPPLVFAGCDELVVDGELAKKMSDERMEGLLAAGVSIRVKSEERPNALRRELWKREGEFWTCAAPGRLRVIEPGLGKVELAWGREVLPNGARWAAMGVVPGAIVVVLLARGLFRRRWTVGAGMAGGMAGLMVVMWMGVRAAAPAAERAMGWTVGDARGISVEERFARVTPFLGQGFSREVEEPAIESVAAGSVREYFQTADVRLSLGQEKAGSLVRVTKLDAGGAVVAVERKILPVRVGDEARAWIVGGYVTESPPTATAPASGGGEVFTQWAERQTEPDAWGAWYEMRFDATHRYGIVTNGNGNIQLLDLGAAASP